jgi:hypothetical protein
LIRLESQGKPISQPDWRSTGKYAVGFAGNATCPLSILGGQKRGILLFEKRINLGLQFGQGELESSAQGHRKKVFQQEPVKLLAEKVEGPAGLVNFQVSNMKGGQKCFKRLDRDRAAVFTRFPFP